jgi:hypothetical protein
MKNPAERKTLTRFRVSNHNLTIELDRYQKIPREERLCEICQSGEVEHHFANSCEAYINQRENFYTTLRNKIHHCHRTDTISRYNEIYDFEIYFFLFYGK